MIYQPVNVYPSNTTIDATVANNFSWEFNGDNLTKYKIEIFQLNESESIYSQEVSPSTTVYGGDIVTYSVPANTMKNGNEYIWKITEYESNPSMFVISGKIQSGSSGSSFTISTKMSTVKVGMSINIDGTYREIKTYDSETGAVTTTEAFSSTPSTGTVYSIYTPFTTTLNGFYFKARTTPVITINPIAAENLDDAGNLKYRRCTFTGSYTQEQNVSIKYHRWDIYEVGEDEVLASSGDVYNSNLTYFYDGFASTIDYKIVLTINTQDAQEYTKELIFHTLYNEPVIVQQPSAIFNPEHNSVTVDCRVIKVSEPVLSDDLDYEFTDGYLHINQGNITYDTISDVPIELEDFTVVTEFYLDEAVANIIINLLTKDETGQYYTQLAPRIDGETLLGSWFTNKIEKSETDITTNCLKSLKNAILWHLQDINTAYDNTEYIWNNTINWRLDDTQFYVYGLDSLNAAHKYKLAMSDEYVILQDWEGNQYRADVNTKPLVINKIRLYAGVYYNYFMVMNDTLSDSDLDKFFADDFVPSWEIFQSTVILAPFFDDSLLSSNIESLTTSVIEYLYIYRQRNDEHIMHYIGRIPLTQLYIEDLMVANDTLYTWHIVPVSDTELGVSVATNSVFVRFDEWTVQPLSLDPDAGNETSYTTDTTWKFGLNIETDALTQNILKTRFDGLAKYPKFTVEKRNYITGSVTAYLSTITVNHLVGTDDLQYYPPYYQMNTDIYYEPAEKLNEWNELVASDRECLVRDIKGHIWRAQIDSNSAIISIYNQVSPTTVTFTFTEVGDYNEISAYIKGEMVEPITSGE